MSHFLWTFSPIEPKVTSLATGIACYSCTASSASHCRHDNPLEAWQEVVTWTHLWKGSLTVSFSPSPFFQSFGLSGLLPNLKSSFKLLSRWHKCVCVCFHCFEYRSCTLVFSFGWSTLLTAAKAPPLMIRLEDLRWAEVHVEAGFYMIDR